MAPRKHWTRPRLIFTQALGVAAGLAAVLAAAGCTSAPAATAAGGASGRPAAPSITQAQARQVFGRVAAVAASVKLPQGAPATAALTTGAERAVVSAAERMLDRIRLSHNVKLAAYDQTYGPPTFYLPEAAAYPRFFVAETTETIKGSPSGATAVAAAGGVMLSVNGTVLMLFEQASASAPWLIASISRLAPGVTLPRLATDRAGYIPIVPLSDTALRAQPDDTGALQAAVVDDGPASAATRVVADGLLTTGMYERARDHAGGLTAPRGDVYQWELAGTSFPAFALRTAGGGALVFYAMALNTTVAVPGYINKANPVRPGPYIQVPADVRFLLPRDQPPALIQLQSQQLLSFAAVDPPPGKAKIQVIAIGGGLTGASAS